MRLHPMRYLTWLVWLVSLMNARAEGWETRTHPDWPGRAFATAVWSDTEVFLWGGEGQDGVLREGWRYDPAQATWRAMSSQNAPAPRGGHQAGWTGREVLVWGGYGQPGGTNAASGFAYGDGGRYDPQVDRWQAITLADAPRPRMGHAAVWTGSEWVIWGGYAGTRWSGLRDDPANLGDGARYQPGQDRWVALAAAGAPASRHGHTAVWTGTEMLVWGGRDQDQAFANGARYQPGTDSWRPLNSVGAPRGRYQHQAVWTGSEMLVWGGLDERGEPVADGGRYDPASDAWRPLGLSPAVANLSLAPTVWTGREWILWGGYDPLAGGWVGTGARYDLTWNTWTPLPGAGAPSARWPTLAWTGREVLVMGGWDASGYRTEVYACLPSVVTNNQPPVLAAIHGLVTDALTQQPVSGVTLQAGAQTIVTEADGRFNFTNLPAGGLRADFAANVTSGPAPLTVQFTATSTDGAYTLSARKTGYLPYSFRPLELAAGESKEWNFSLSPSLDNQPPAGGGSAGGETNLTRYHWLFGDGTGGDLENPAKTYLTPGAYTVNLELTVPDGRTVSVNKPQLIRVLASPVGPRLTLTRIGGEAAITWASEAGGYVLEQRADFRAGAWVAVPLNPTQNGNVYSVRVSLSGRSFYRLEKGAN